MVGKGGIIFYQATFSNDIYMPFIYLHPFFAFWHSWRHFIFFLLSIFFSQVCIFL
ncbi:hypothetical protein QBC41DRAFT_311778 [Cercophora samala]|uniref:Uncharacterized protein n=1 Tax=Cercophora samala TaxID=330535 RepID=A0AA40DFL1_9PEZI|nr:hypothetical protein QBC41DRAFT_311778 [Cercophora samala]